MLTRLLHARSWVLRCLAHSLRPVPSPSKPLELLLCIADHFEPKLGGAPPDVARKRVERWAREYPMRFGDLRDADGLPPRHTFFYPEEEYEEPLLAPIAELCRKGFGEVEVHLHHDHDTAAGLREKLLRFKQILEKRHGLLSVDKKTGETKYGFIHGNWALDNSLPGGRWCGVTNELEVLRETGCYADFTLPSAPSPAQSKRINDIYYAKGTERPKSHDRGWTVGAGPERADCLMIVQGPLVLDWRRRRGVLPVLENGCLQASQPLDVARLPAWCRAGVGVRKRRDWLFVKLHTHGAAERNTEMLLGDGARRFHEDLAALAAREPAFRFHYVSAREMYNLAKAAESGWTGDVNGARDFRLERR